MYVIANLGISRISCSRYVKDVRKQEGLIEMMLRVYDLKYIVSYIKNFMEYFTQSRLEKIIKADIFN